MYELETLQAFANEVHLMSRLRHPNVIQFLACCFDPYVCLVLELAPQVLVLARHVREVLLQNGGTPWVFARSVIPVVLMETEFNQLGSQPLGKRLFNDDRFERGAFELCKVGNSSFAGDTGVTLLGRRSCFHYRQHALLVAELFLPASPVYQTER